MSESPDLIGTQIDRAATSTAPPPNYLALEISRQKARAAAEDSMREFVTAVPAAHQVSEALASINNTIDNAREAAQEALGNLDLFPAGREARAEQAYAEAADAIEAEFSAANARLDILEHALESQAFPEPTGSAGISTRTDVLALLDRAPNRMEALAALAADSNPHVRALVAGEWGQRYARISGLSGDVTSNVRAIAMQREAEIGDGDRARAAKGWLAIGSARAALGGTFSLAKSMLPIKYGTAVSVRSSRQVR